MYIKPNKHKTASHSLQLSYTSLSSYFCFTTSRRGSRWQVSHLIKGSHLCVYVLQDSNCYMTHLAVQAQSNSQFTDIPLTERQRLKDDHSSTSLRFLNLPLGIGTNDRGPPFQVVIRVTMYLPVLGIELTSSVFLG